MPPAVLPSPPINRLSAATSRSSRDAAALAEGDCGAASGVRLADSACRSAAASFTGSPWPAMRSEEHTSELQSLMRISYAVFCLKKKKNKDHERHTNNCISNNIKYRS